MYVVLGIDGGGSTTRAALVSGLGEVLGVGRGGPANFQDVGLVAARQNLEAAVQQAWCAAGHPQRRCAAVFLGMAGVVSPADRADISALAAELALAEDSRIGVDHDIRVALAGGLAGEEGIALIVGTGSSCYGRRRDGRNWRAGGWGHLLDDLGAAVYLGLQGIIATVRAHDGRGQATLISQPLLAAMQLDDIQGVMRALYHERMSRAQIAALAPLVVTAAAQGDAVARRIIEHGADELALMAETVARKLEFPPAAVKVTVTGSVARCDLACQRPLYAALRRRLPHCTIVEPQLQPVYGAALLALELSGTPVTPALVANMVRTAGAHEHP
jgi:N-acetylglucosamine kinase-like BadF-type ATPase